MVLILSISLAISIVGMISLLSVKRYELNSGKVFLPSVRPRASSFFHRLSMWVGRMLPQMVSAHTSSLKDVTIDFIHRTVARAVLMFEHTLERVLTLVREKTMPERGGAQASAFLREVADHKKNLLKKTRSRAIFEE